MYITNHNKSYLCPNTVRLYSFAEAKSTFNLFKLTTSSLSWCTCKTDRWFRRSCLVTIAKSSICCNASVKIWTLLIDFCTDKLRLWAKHWTCNASDCNASIRDCTAARLSGHLTYWWPHLNTDHVSCLVGDPDESNHLELYCLYKLLQLCLLFRTSQ